MSKLKYFSMIVMVAVCLSNLGCMIGPNHRDIVDDRDELLYFHGVTLQSGETIEVQAKRVSDGVWVKIGEVQTQPIPVPWSGQTWYFAGGDFAVPHSCWKLHVLGSVDRIRYSAEVRMVTSDGFAMFAYKKGYSDWFMEQLNLVSMDPFDATQQEVAEWSAGKNSATIYTKVITP